MNNPIINYPAVCRQKPCRREKGFTIIEVMGAIAVFVLIFGALMASIVAIYRTQGYAVDQAIAINEARRGVDIMTNELRQARYGDNGAYPIEKASGKELIFYSDVDDDGQSERVRYYLAMVQSGTRTQECRSSSQGGACSVNFNNFLTGTLISAQVRVSTEGYYGTSSRYAEFYVDGSKIGNMCQTGCSQCAGAWQGVRTFDVTAAAMDNSIQLTMDSTSNVRAQCQWINPNHSMKVLFELMFMEEVPNSGTDLRKGVTEPAGSPVSYPTSQEQSKIITKYVRNAPPIFSYFDKNGSQIDIDTLKITDTKMVKLYMVVNVDVNRAPNDYVLQQYVQVRNLKEE